MQKIKEIWQRLCAKIKSLFHIEVEKDTPVNSVMEYRERIKRYKNKVFIRTVIIVAAVLALLITAKITVDRWSYGDYKIVTTSVQEISVSAKYTEFGENILKYGGDEIAMLNRQESVIWTAAETMDNPEVEVCQNSCLVYDKKGTTMSIFDIEGKVGSIQTTLPILKAKVASQGVVAAILEDGDTTWVHVYDSDGENIVTAKTRMDSPGYPVDLSISEDGLLMAVSYLKVENNKIASYVTFYNFGNTGQNQMDNMVSSYTYTDTLVPDVEYLDETYAVAFREDGFSVYKGKQIPEEECSVEVSDEIVSVFYDKSSVGLILRNINSEQPYRMELYNLKGKLKWSVEMDQLYDEIKVSKNQILLYNNTGFAVYSMKGVCRYQGAMKEGTLKNFFKIAHNRYMAVLEGGIETIKLS